MTAIEFEFEELELIPGFCALASGSAEIVGDWEGPDRDVGIMHGHWNYYVHDIYIDPIKYGEKRRSLKGDDPFYKIIRNELESRSTYYDLIQAEFESTRE